MPGVLKFLILGVDGREVGPIVVNAETADNLLDWHYQDKGKPFMLLGQLPTNPRDVDKTVRTVALQVRRGHVGYIQVEAVRDA